MNILQIPENRGKIPCFSCIYTICFILTQSKIFSSPERVSFFQTICSNSNFSLSKSAFALLNVFCLYSFIQICILFVKKFQINFALIMRNYSNVFQILQADFYQKLLQNPKKCAIIDIYQKSRTSMPRPQKCRRVCLEPQFSCF